MAGIFISYRRADSAFHAAWLHEHLAARFGDERVFMDVHDINAGDDFVRVLNEKLSHSAALIALIGPRWLSGDNGVRRIDDERDFVRLEIATALARKIRVIPALLNGAAMPAEADLPPVLAPLSRCHAVNLTDSHFHGDAEKLIAGLDEVIAANERSLSWRNPRLRKVAAAVLLATAAGGQHYVAQLPAVTEVAPHFNPASIGRGEELIIGGTRVDGPLLAYEGRVGEGVDVHVPRARLHRETLALLNGNGAALPATEAEVRVIAEHVPHSKSFFTLDWNDADGPGGKLRIFQLPEPMHDRAHFDLEAAGAALQLRILGPSRGGDAGKAVKHLWVGGRDVTVAGDIPIKLVVPEHTSISFRFWTLKAADEPGAKLWFDSFALGATEMGAGESPPFQARSIGDKAGDAGEFALIACAARRGEVLWSGLRALSAGECGNGSHTALLRVTDFKVGAKELQMRVTGNGWVAPAGKVVLSVWQDIGLIAAVILGLNLVLVLWLALEFLGRGVRRMVGKTVS